MGMDSSSHATSDVDPSRKERLDHLVHDARAVGEIAVMTAGAILVLLIGLHGGVSQLVGAHGQMPGRTNQQIVSTDVALRQHSHGAAVDLNDTRVVCGIVGGTSPRDVSAGVAGRNGLAGLGLDVGRVPRMHAHFIEWPRIASRKQPGPASARGNVYAAAARTLVSVGSNGRVIDVLECR